MCLRAFSILCTKIYGHIKSIPKKLLLIQIRTSKKNSNFIKTSLCILNICFRIMLESEDFISMKGM